MYVLVKSEKPTPFKGGSMSPLTHLAILKNPVLIEYLRKEGYFTCPASGGYHGSYNGGLLDHCVNVFMLYLDYCQKFKLDITIKDIITAAYLHDLCKLKSYKQFGEKFVYDYTSEKGHAMLSIKRIKAVQSLTELQVSIIKFHMGSYAIHEGTTKIKEYSIKEMHEAFKDPRVKCFYLADEFATQIESTEIRGD